MAQHFHNATTSAEFSHILRQCAAVKDFLELFACQKWHKHTRFYLFNKCVQLPVLHHVQHATAQFYRQIWQQ
jgi:hypothetical protein